MAPTTQTNRVYAVGAISFVRARCMTRFQLLLIGCGGFAGALARYFVGTLIQGRLTTSSFPWGTFVINVTGSFILGLFATLIGERFLSNPNWRPLVTIGFVGAYTTFSTFEYETFQLTSSRQAMMNMLGSVAVGYVAIWAGSRIAHLIIGHANYVTAR